MKLIYQELGVYIMKKIVFLSVMAVVMSSLLSLHTAFANEKEAVQRSVQLPEINNTMNQIQDDAIWKMNEYRSKLGLPLFDKNILLQRASQSHANYHSLNNELSHYQNENGLGFTGVRPGDRGKYFGYTGYNLAEGITYGAQTGNEGINSLFDAPYHRKPIMSPRYTEVGTGYNASGHLVVNYANESRSPVIAKEHEVVTYPYQNQKNAKTSWMALESPNPLRFWNISSSQLKTVGYPISYFYFGKGDLVVKKAVLKDALGKVVPSYNVTPELEPGENLLFIIPKEPLELRQTYHVAVDAYVNVEGHKEDTSKEWSFTTMEEVDVTDIYFVAYDEGENNLVVEFNNEQEIDYQIALERDGKVFLSSDRESEIIDGHTYQHVYQTIHHPITNGEYTLKVTVPTLLKELILPVNIQKDGEKFNNHAGEWKVTFDRQGKSTKKINFLFKDVKEGMAHYEGIKYMVDHNIVSGFDGYFSPWKSAHRGHVAKMIVNALDLELVSAKEMDSILNMYADVTKDNSFAPYIATATKAGIFKGSAIPGSNKRQFGTSKYTNREQMATVLVRAFDLNSIEADDVAMNLTHVSKDHQPNVQVLANLGITDQLDDFGPKKQISRAALSTFLYRVMNR